MIYCVEDDKSIRDLMMYTLRTSGYEAEGFNDGEELFDALAKAEGSVDLIMLDIMLPGDDGLEILKKLRENPATREIPVIMETAKGTEFDKVIGLDAGADDYLTKPFGMMEMLARVKAVLRRTQTAIDRNSLKIGELEMNISEHTVKVDGERVILTLKEFELLQLFMQKPGHAFSRESLLAGVWGVGYIGETRTVDVHIGTLRTKLGEAGKYIETVRGIGYRMSDI